MALAVKLKNPAVREATTNILRPISGEKILSITDLHCKGLRVKVV